MPDVPVVYMVEPTNENIRAIVKDAQNDLYDYIIVNFTRPASPEKIEAFAQAMVQADQVHKVLKIESDFIGGYQVIAPDFFVLPQMTDSRDDTFTRLYAMRHENVLSSAIIYNVAYGLFCLFKSMGLPAPIVHLANGVGDNLTGKVCEELHKLYKDSGCENEGPAPILILMDRFADLHTMVHHSWSYLT